VRELEEAMAQRRRHLWGFAAGLAMTAVGSFAVWGVAARATAARSLTPAGLAAAVAVFGALPSLAAALLLVAPSAFTSPYEEEL
jgi:divalent metal cation (Fe/Co/Zn/Cd) transporter